MKNKIDKFNNTKNNKFLRGEKPTTMGKWQNGENIQLTSQTKLISLTHKELLETEENTKSPIEK